MLQILFCGEMRIFNYAANGYIYIVDAYGWKISSACMAKAHSLNLAGRVSTPAQLLVCFVHSAPTPSGTFDRIGRTRSTWVDRRRIYYADTNS
jgi:hypothetical protein